MGTYTVTGSASGMGAAVAARLSADGHTVIGVDLRDATVVADLSTQEGRADAARGVLDLVARSGGTLDGAVLAAGIGPGPGEGRSRLIAEVNHLGVVDLLDAWRPALAAAGNAKVVAFASNSTTTVPMVPDDAIDGLLERDVDRAVTALAPFGDLAASIAYAASKIAVSRWVRRHAVTREWAGAGIRLNAIAPGAILTPLLEQQLSTPEEAERIRSFPVPIGGFGDADHLATWVVLMLSPAADFMCGSVVFVDGGSDAWFRADDWPGSLPGDALGSYLERAGEFTPYA